MILLSLLILGFASADLLRWSPDRVLPGRTALSAIGAMAITCALASLSGASALEVALVEVGILIAVGVWLGFDLTSAGPGYQLAWLLAALAISFGLGGLVDPASGSLGRWYSDLPFGFTRSTSVDQLLLGLSSTLFLTATSNRVVRLVLQTSSASIEAGENSLRGGRLLGPMERLFVGAMVISGNLTAVGAIIAAKGLLRLPEIRSNEDQRDGAGDQITEYFLIGTFCSLLIASALGTLISVSS